MISANKIFFILILMCGISFSQSLENQFQLAENLFKEKNYFNAITEYKRLIFFDSKKEFSFKANFKIAESYFGGAKLDDAVKYFSIASYNSKNENEYCDTQIQLIRCNILRGTISNSFLIIERLNNDSRFKNKKDELIYWRGWTNIFNDDWKKASENFKSIDEKFLAEFCDSINSKKYSPNFAKVISFLIPGAGQFYTGKYLSGIMSLAWNLGFGYLSATSFLDERIFDGFIHLNLLARFYRGNIQNVERFANEKNLKIRNDALNFLQNNFEGKKP